MRMTVVGLEASEGVGKNSGAAYSIGQLHVTVPLAPPLGAGGVAKGCMGATYRVEVELVKSLQHNPVPFDADLELSQRMRFGKLETTVQAVVPVGLSKQPKAA